MSASLLRLGLGTSGTKGLLRLFLGSGAAIAVTATITGAMVSGGVIANREADSTISGEMTSFGGVAGQGAALSQGTGAMSSAGGVAGANASISMSGVMSSAGVVYSSGSVTINAAMTSSGGLAALGPGVVVNRWYFVGRIYGT